jgi:hypothetical protein
MGNRAVNRPMVNSGSFKIPSPPQEITILTENGVLGR